MAENALTDLLPNRPSLSAKEIMQAVAKHYGLSLDELRGPRRSRRISQPRQVAMYLIREETEASLPQIGAQLGGRDHTTIMYGCERVRARMEEEDQLRREILALKTKLYEHN
jgi:chromosomal replication initiator protein